MIHHIEGCDYWEAANRIKELSANEPMFVWVGESGEYLAIPATSPRARVVHRYWRECIAGTFDPEDDAEEIMHRIREAYNESRGVKMEDSKAANRQRRCNDRKMMARRAAA